MIWHYIYLVAHLLWDSLRFSRLSPDDKTLELLLLRQHLLIVRRHQKRSPTITRTEKLMLLTLVEQLRPVVAPPKARTDRWQPSPDLHYGQLVKRKNKRHIIFTHTRMLWGQRHELFARLREVGLCPLIQTAFVERVNLTFRQSVATLAQRTWAYAQTQRHLLLHCEWFRLYYHFVRAHESLAREVPGLKRRFRSRSPAMALDLTDHLWSVHDLLHYPVPQVA